MTGVPTAICPPAAHPQCVPYRLGTLLATIPGATPYLAADPAQSQLWCRRLAGLGGLDLVIRVDTAVAHLTGALG